MLRIFLICRSSAVGLKSSTNSIFSYRNNRAYENFQNNATCEIIIRISSFLYISDTVGANINVVSGNISLTSYINRHIYTNIKCKMSSLCSENRVITFFFTFIFIKKIFLLSLLSRFYLINVTNMTKCSLHAHF